MRILHVISVVLLFVFFASLLIHPLYSINSEVVFYGLNNAIGLKGLILFKAVVLLLAMGLLLASVYSKTRLWALVISSLAGFMVFMERTDVRPETNNF